MTMLIINQFQKHGVRKRERERERERESLGLRRIFRHPETGNREKSSM